MAKQRNALKAGIFIAVGAALIVAILIGIKGLGAWTVPVQIRKASFTLADNIGGLRVGDQVRVGGFKVGVVRSIDVVTPAAPSIESPKVIVTYSIPRKFHLRQGAKLGIETTVTGTSVLNFQNLGQGAELPADEPLAGEPSALQQIFASASQAAPELRDLIKEIRTTTVPKANAMVDKFSQTADSATDFASHLRAQTDPALKSYHTVADSAVKAMDSVSALFGDVKTDFRGTVSNLNAITAQFKERLPALLDQMDAFLKEANTTVAGINGSLDDIKKTIANARASLGSAREIISGNRSKIENMIAALKATADNLKGASEEIRRSPWRLLYKPEPGEIDNLNIFDSARQFASGANDLNDAAGALRDALKQPNPDPDKIKALLKQLDASFNKFQTVEKGLWQSVRE